MDKIQTTADLISEGCALRAQIAGCKSRLAAIEGMLLQLSPGKHQGVEIVDSVNVIVPSPAMSPSAQAIERVRAMVDEDVFRKLFVRVVTYKPVKGLREIVGAILTPAKAAKVTRECEQAGSAYLLWS